MLFSIQLSADYPSKDYGGDRVYGDMLDQAVLADQLGFDAVSITEHHLMNCLMMPAPLQFAVKIAAMTKRIQIMTSIVVLPLHAMRVKWFVPIFSPKGGCCSGLAAGLLNMKWSVLACPWLKPKHVLMNR